MVKYKPGVCNINQVEKKKRLVGGLAAFLNSAILIFVLVAFPQLTPLYAAVFLLNFAGFLGYLQYRKSFCTGLALKKKFHVDDEDEEIESPEEVSQDRKKVLMILLESGFMASALTLAVYLALANF